MTTARRNLILFALALGAFAIGTSEFSGMTLLPFYAREFGRDQPTAAHAVSLYALGVVVGAPVLALATARRRRLTAATVPIAAAAVANVLTTLSDGYPAMLGARFLSGIPHGAFFGQAALIAAALMPDRRATAVALVMTGLTVATVIGAPAANYLGLHVGWRAGFAVAAASGAASACLLALHRGALPAGPTLALSDELAALANRQVWLTLLAGAIGFGGLFAVYAYLPAIAENDAGVRAALVPWLLSLVGIGLLVGNFVAGWAADRFGTRAGLYILLWSAIACASLPLAAGGGATLAIASVAIALTAGLGPVLQIRLMDVADESQTLAAAMHHAAFNMANALGPWLAGLAISAGWGWSAAGPVGAILALGGLATLGTAMLTLRRERS